MMDRQTGTEEKELGTEGQGQRVRDKGICTGTGREG